MRRMKPKKRGVGEAEVEGEVVLVRVGALDGRVRKRIPLKGMNHHQCARGLLLLPLSNAR